MLLSRLYRLMIGLEMIGETVHKSERVFSIVAFVVDDDDDDRRIKGGCCCDLINLQLLCSASNSPLHRSARFPPKERGDTATLFYLFAAHTMCGFIFIITQRYT